MSTPTWSHGSVVEYTRSTEQLPTFEQKVKNRTIFHQVQGSPQFCPPAMPQFCVVSSSPFAHNFPPSSLPPNSGIYPLSPFFPLHPVSACPQVPYVLAFTPIFNPELYQNTTPSPSPQYARSTSIKKPYDRGEIISCKWGCSRTMTRGAMPRHEEGCLKAPKEIQDATSQRGLCPVPECKKTYKRNNDLYNHFHLEHPGVTVANPPMLKRSTPRKKMLEPSHS
jgi:hypothetical protein